MKIEPWLSLLIWMELNLYPISSRIDLIQIHCQLQSEKAIYSVSVKKSAIVL